MPGDDFKAGFSGLFFKVSKVDPDQALERIMKDVIQHFNDNFPAANVVFDNVIGELYSSGALEKLNLYASSKYLENHQMKLGDFIERAFLFDNVADTRDQLIIDAVAKYMNTAKDSTDIIVKARFAAIAPLYEILEKATTIRKTIKQLEEPIKELNIKPTDEGMLNAVYYPLSPLNKASEELSALVKLHRPELKEEMKALTNVEKEVKRTLSPAALKSYNKTVEAEKENLQPPPPPPRRFR